MLKKLLFAVLLMVSFAVQAAVYSLPWGPKPQFVDANGAPMSGGTLQTFAGSSTTPQVTYTDSTGSVANATTITLNVRGETQNEVWLTGGQTYKFVLKDAASVTVWTVDNVSGVNDTTGAQSEWIAGPAPTFVGTTSFTLAGDQTPNFHIGRRLKTTNSGGTIYSTITNSVFGAATTVTVVNDSGNLDSGLSAVSYGLVSASNTSVSPQMINRKGTAVASAATANIWNVVGDFVHISGTTPITSFGTAPYAGAERTVIFDGALTLTHNATTLVLPGGQSITTAANDRAVVRADTTANAVVVAYIPAYGVSQTVPRGQLAGLTMSTAGGSATMTIAAGQAADSTNAVLMNLTASLAKTTSAWAVGAGGCLDTGAIANSTWYHFYEIMRADTGVVDVLCSLSASAPTMPANYTPKRRIGSGLTNGSAQWTAFSQLGDEFLWSATVLDVNAANPGNSAVTRTLTVPTGVQVNAIVNWAVAETTNATSAYAYISSLDVSDEATSLTAAPLIQTATAANGAAGVSNAATQLSTRTNTSAQVRSRLLGSAASVTLRAATVGWIDRRGKDL